MPINRANLASESCWRCCSACSTPMNAAKGLCAGGGCGVGFRVGGASTPVMLAHPLNNCKRDAGEHRDVTGRCATIKHWPNGTVRQLVPAPATPGQSNRDAQDVPLTVVYGADSGTLGGSSKLGHSWGVAVRRVSATAARNKTHPERFFPDGRAPSSCCQGLGQEPARPIGGWRKGTSASLPAATPRFRSQG